MSIEVRKIKMISIYRAWVTLLTLTIVFFLAACGDSTASTPASPAVEPTTPAASAPETQPAPSDTVDLRVAVLPVLNTMPLFVAQEQGFYQEQGVSVELVPVESARDRQIALQAGQVDGANTDLMGVILLAGAGSPIKAVRHDSFAEGFRFFSIVAGSQSGLTTPQALIAALEANEAQIAISNNTIIEYLTTTMLASAGYSAQPDDYLEVADIPIRLEQVAQGTVAAGTLPEPLTTLATEVQGGTAILSDSDIDFVPTVVAFNQSVLDNKPEAVRAFLAAYEQAVVAINSEPETYRDNPVRIPDPVRATYTVPQFVTARVPTEIEVQSVIDWMLVRGLIDQPVSYSDLVDAGYLP